jgi:hypothetical protein
MSRSRKGVLARVPLKVRQERLGRGDPSLTLGAYTHVASEDDVRIAEQLDAILRPNRKVEALPQVGNRL